MPWRVLAILLTVAWAGTRPLPGMAQPTGGHTLPDVLDVGGTPLDNGYSPWRPGFVVDQEVAEAPIAQTPRELSVTARPISSLRGQGVELMRLDMRLEDVQLEPLFEEGGGRGAGPGFSPPFAASGTASAPQSPSSGRASARSSTRR